MKRSAKDRPRYRKILLLAVTALSLLLMAGVGLFAESTKPITRKGLEDALRLGGLQPGELVAIIEKRGVDFESTSEIEKELKGLGADADILQAVKENYRGAPQPRATPPPYAPPPPPPAAPAPGSSIPRATGIYLKEGSTWTPLRQESAEWRKEGLMKGLKMATDGLVNGEATGEVAGTHSSTATRSPASFMIRMEYGLSVQDYIVVHMHGKHDNREFKIGMNALRSKDEVELHTTKVANDLVEVDFAQGAGDYAFISRRGAPTTDNYTHSGFLYTFQIVQ